MDDSFVFSTRHTKNMQESEYDIEWGNSEQEKDSNQPRQNKELISKRGYFCRMDMVW